MLVCGCLRAINRVGKSRHICILMRDQVRLFRFMLERTEEVFHLQIFFCLLYGDTLVDLLFDGFNFALMLAQRLLKAASILALEVALFFKQLFCFG